jgi:hypothetical protein
MPQHENDPVAISQCVDRYADTARAADDARMSLPQEALATMNDDRFDALLAALERRGRPVGDVDRASTARDGVLLVSCTTARTDRVFSQWPVTAPQDTATVTTLGHDARAILPGDGRRGTRQRRSRFAAPGRVERRGRESARPSAATDRT